MRLIDADALIEFIVEEAQDLRTLSTKTVGQAISKTPTVDAVSVEDHKIIVEKARREAYHSGYKQGRFDEFIEAQYGRGDYDIVPVCRCKDCKHMHEDGVESYCDDSGRYIDGTGFCKWAERKEE